MRILFLNDYGESFGGAETYMYNLKKLLEENGVIVRVYGGDSITDLGSLFSRWFSIKHYLKVRKEIREFKPDLVHVHNLSRCLSPSVVAAAKNMKVPVIMTVHDFHLVCPKTWMVYEDGSICKLGFGKKCLKTKCPPNQNMTYTRIKWVKVWLHRRTLKKHVDLFICPSKELTRWMGKNMKVNTEYMPYFIEEKTDIRGKKGSDSFLFVGRLCREKGLDILIEAVRKLREKHPEIEVRIVGVGPERKRIEKLVKEWGLTDSVRFEGRINQSRIREYFQKSSATVIPSLWVDNSPLVAYESMSNSTPVIASRVGGFKDLVDDRIDGLLFDRGDSKGLAEKMEYIIENPDKADDMGEKTGIKAKTEYNPGKHLERIRSIYERVAKG